MVSFISIFELCLRQNAISNQNEVCYKKNLLKVKRNNVDEYDELSYRVGDENQIETIFNFFASHCKSYLTLNFQIISFYTFILQSQAPAHFLCVFLYRLGHVIEQSFS